MEYLEHILNTNNELGEGPIWNVNERKLYWVDINRHKVHRFFPATQQLETFDLGLPVTCIGFRQSGGLVLAVRDGFATWDVEHQILQYICKPEQLGANSRFNDGSVDRRGRFWAGTMGKTPTNHLFRLDPDHSVHVMETGINISNGIGWSTDYSVMYYTDTPTKKIDIYDFNLDTGSIERRRLFAAVPATDGVPDGLTVDEDGFIWSACWGGWKIIRYAPDGSIDREIPLPVQYPTSCTFGGDDMNELYITSAREPLTAEERQKKQFDGDLFRIKADVRGIPQPEYLG